MNNPLVYQLAHTDPEVAEAIRSVMHAAYQVEAELLGVADFFPLRRTAAQIAGADALFYAIAADGSLAAVAEMETEEPGHSHIGSLVVHPCYFRRGLASALLRHIFHTQPSQQFTVSTGRANRPALLLYVKAGFREDRLWTTDDGIPMVTLLRPKSPPHTDPIL